MQTSPAGLTGCSRQPSRTTWAASVLLTHKVSETAGTVGAGAAGVACFVPVSQGGRTTAAETEGVMLRVPCWALAEPGLQAGLDMFPAHAVTQSHQLTPTQSHLHTHTLLDSVMLSLVSTQTLTHLHANSHAYSQSPLHPLVHLALPPDPCDLSCPGLQYMKRVHSLTPALTQSLLHPWVHVSLQLDPRRLTVLPRRYQLAVRDTRALQCRGVSGPAETHRGAARLGENICPLRMSGVCCLVPAPVPAPVRSPLGVPEQLWVGLYCWGAPGLGFRVKKNLNPKPLGRPVVLEVAPGCGGTGGRQVVSTCTCLTYSVDKILHSHHVCHVPDF